MNKNVKNKIVVDRLAENLQKYAQGYLRTMLQEFIVEFHRDWLFEDNDYKEEIYIAFPEFGKDLKIEPVNYEVGKNLSFAFTFSGTFEQLQVGEYTYKYKGYIPDTLRQRLEQEAGIICEDSGVENESEPYTMVTLSKPFQDKRLTFKQAEPHKNTAALGTGSFEVPLNVTFQPGAGYFKLDVMYLSDPNGNREDSLTDAYNRPICYTFLKNVFSTTKLPGTDIELRMHSIMTDPHGELPDKDLGVAPGTEALKIEINEIDFGKIEDIDIPHRVLAARLIDSLKKRLFHPLDLDENMADEGTEEAVAETGVNVGKKVSTPEERAEKILSDFAVFHYEKKYSGAYVEFELLHPELYKARYNLLIRANDQERALEFVDILKRNVSPKIREDKFKALSEEDIKAIIASKDKEKLDEFKNLFHTKDLIVIYDCLEKPVLRWGEMGTGSKLEEVKKEIEDYELRWGVIAELARMEENNARLIVIANDIVYRNTLRYNADIHDAVCEYHLWLQDLTADEMYQLFIEELKDSSFGKRLDDDFEKSVKEYIRTVYPKSEIRGRQFIDDHLSKIYTKYIVKEDMTDGTLSGCIPEYKIPSVDRILAELKKKIGLGEVAERFETIYAMKDVLARAGEPYHMSFEGNPGTGKTMVAKMMAEMLYHMGVTKKPILVEMRAGDFKSQWQGGTNKEVRGKIREAYGGVLFIDEAYGLADEKFQEGLAILLMEMADKENPERPVVILAGYEERMRDLLKANEGLDSRIKYHVIFRDYTRAELKDILKEKLKELEFTVEKTDEADSLLDALILEKMSSEFFGNARDMEKLCFELTGIWGKQKAADEKEEKYAKLIIRAEHMKELLPKTDTESINKILKDQPGMKQVLDKFKSGVAYKKKLQNETHNAVVPAANLHMVFAGNPGTGKTTVAGMLADYLCEMHVLPTNKCITVEAKDLLSFAKNMTPAQHMEDYIMRAKGGILFVDEAYALAKEQGGSEVIHVLLTAMEKYKRDTIFVFAGYPREMDEFLAMNPGLRSRIGHVFRFESFSEKVLAKMFIDKMKGLELSFANEEEAEIKLEEIMRYFRRMSDFGNGRFVENLVNATMNKHGEYLAKKYPADEKEPDKKPALWNCPPDEIVTYTVEDIPAKKEILMTFFGIDRDPDEYEKREKETTAIHELGHATVAMAADTNRDPGVEKITIRSEYDVYGYVRFDLSKFRTERDYKVHLAVGLGGRNAEKLYFGSHTHGCRGDYESAKRLAEQMIKEFAMGDLGVTSEIDLLREADAWATKLLYDNKEFIDEMKPFLLKHEELDGKNLKLIYDVYRNDGLEEMRAYLKDVENELEELKH